MFTVHTVSTGLANSLKDEQKSLTSGMYLSFYYIGGASGSIFPSIIYDYYGWNIMIYCLMFIIFLILIISFKSRALFLRKVN
jgi:YNFM family putative membrane transporter